ncbi:hypothetical protein [Hoeflea sp. TYP-13]|uniref:hypothetical protein n=1 Tax=Hoeflea sp. TYP-13 TaxID=3230023 RepID=UPI0034C5E781
MRFIIKAVFWFAIVLLFLPGNSLNTRKDNIDHSTTTGTISSSVEIRKLADRLQSICVEDPDMCATGLRNVELMAAILRDKPGYRPACPDNLEE